MSSRRLGSSWLVAGLGVMIVAAVTLAAVSLRSFSRLAESMESERRQELAGRAIALQAAMRDEFQRLKAELETLLDLPEGAEIPPAPSPWTGWSLSSSLMDRLGGPRPEWDPDLGAELSALLMTDPKEAGLFSALSAMGPQKEPVREIYRRMLMGRHHVIAGEPREAVREFLAAAAFKVRRQETVWCAVAALTKAPPGDLRIRALETLGAKAGEGPWPEGVRAFVLGELKGLAPTEEVGVVQSEWIKVNTMTDPDDAFGTLWAASTPSLREALASGATVRSGVVWIPAQRRSRLAFGALAIPRLSEVLKETWSRIPGRHGVEIELVTAPEGEGEFVKLAIPGLHARLTPVGGAALSVLETEERLLSRSTVAFLLVVLAVGAALSLVAALRAAREARLKGDFVSLVSHELRTPLTSIQMFVETLKEGRASSEEDRQGALSILDTETRRLRGLIERLLSFSILERGADFIQEEVSLNRIARHACELMRPQFEAAGMRLETLFPEEELAVQGDGTALAELCLNLLANAITHGRGAEASLSVVRQGPKALIEVADRGAGLSAKARKIFKPFERGASSEPGLGLGLALVRRIAKAHGGSVEALDREGGGALFRVTLPLALDPATPASTMEG